MGNLGGMQVKIVANGYGRNVVGYHTLTDSALDASAFHVTDDGVEIYVPRSKKLGLGGYFRLHVYLTTEEIRQALHSATITKLEKRIADLEKKLST